MPISHAEQIAQSAAVAAWVGAGASTFASVVALSVAVWSARREEGRRRRLARDEETAFAFGMVGAFEMIKPMVVAAHADPEGEVSRRRFADTMGHAVMIADAALGIRVFDMQMLRDGYLVRGALHALNGLLETRSETTVPHAAILAALEPVLDGLVEGDDRFFARLPTIATVKGIHDRTPIPGRTG